MLKVLSQILNKKISFSIFVLLYCFLWGESFGIAQVFPPGMSSPVPGTTLTSASVTFTGNHTSQDLEHWLYVGTSVGAKDLHNSGSLGTGHTRAVSGLPSSGTIHVRYWSRNSGGWASQDHTYTMNVASGGSVTVIPATATLAPGAQQDFDGSGGIPPYFFIVQGDTTGGASIDFFTGLYTAGPNPGTTTVRMVDSSLPEQAANALVTVQGSGTTFPPGMSSPVPGTTLTSASVTFTGNHTSQDLEHWLYVGTSVGAKDLHNSGSLGTGHTRAVSGLPSSGTIHVRYWSRNSGGWASQDHTYTMNVASGGSVTVIPATATLAPGAQQDFDGSGGIPPYFFIVQGDTTGGASIDFFTGLYTAGPNPGTTTVRMVDSSLPEQAANALVTVQGSGTTFPPGMSSPVPGTTLTSASVTFTGNHTSQDLEHWLYVGTSVGAKDLHNSGSLGTGHTRAVSGLPSSGTIHVRYWSRNSGGWASQDHTYTMNTGGGGTFPQGITNPVPGTTVTTASVTFIGGHTTQDLEHWLYVGTSVGAKNLHNSGSLGTGHTRAVSGLPTSGTIHVRWWSRNSSGWQWQDHSYPMNVGGGGVISQAGWTVHFVDSQETANLAVNAFDGISSTAWKNQVGDPFPHDLQINLGNVFEIEGFRVITRVPIESHAISFFEFYVSEDGVSWGAPVASGELSKDFVEMEVKFPKIPGSFVRIKPIGWHDGGEQVKIGELNVLGASFSGNYPPNGTIDLPIDNVTINIGGSVSFSGTFSDSNGHSALSYLWDFGGGAPNSTVKDPGSVVFNTPGTYKVTFTVTDSLGLSDPYPDTVTVKVGSSSTLSRSNWTIEFVNSEEVTLGSHAAANVLDGNINTFWHTQFNDVDRPHEIHFNLGAAYALDGLRYLPRQSGVNGRIIEYHIYVSADGQNWGSPVAIGQFANNATEQRVQFSPKTGQFIRLVAITEANGNPWASIAEANVEGLCQDPFVRLINPLTNEVQNRPNLTVRASVCLTQASHAGWGVKFSVNGGAQEQTITLPADGIIHPDTFEWVVSGLVGDGHQVEAFIVDNLGNQVSGSNTYDIVANIGLGNVLTAIGDSITVGVGDDDSTDGTSQDGRNTNTGLGYTPILNDLLTVERGYPHNVYNDGISGDSSAGVLVRTAKILKSRKETSAFLLLIGSNDANSGLVPSGKGLNPGDSGYAGTYKDNLQQIINLLHNPAQGREIYLAKVPYTTNVASNSFVQDYNISINELVTSNSLTVTPPDLFTHFQANQQELRADGLHPNGQGYKSIASLWCIAISGGTCP